MAVIAYYEAEGKVDPNFGTASMLGIAYSACIGGVGTLVGTVLITELMYLVAVPAFGTILSKTPARATGIP